MKRIRPARLTENDLSVEAYSELLWAFEGITSYYDDLGLARAAVIDASSYLELLARTITRLFRTGGRHRQSVAESSFFAWTKFYKQDENAPNAIVSYYAKGALVALGLDVTLRRISRDRLSLDDLMRHLWNRYGKAAEGVAEDGIEGAAAELVAGLDDADGLAAFFAAFVHGTEELPLKEWLGVLGVGMRLRAQANPKDNGGVAQKPDKDEDPAKPALGATFSSAIDRSQARANHRGRRRPVRRACSWRPGHCRRRAEGQRGQLVRTNNGFVVRCDRGNPCFSAR